MMVSSSLSPLHNPAQNARYFFTHHLETRSGQPVSHPKKPPFLGNVFFPLIMGDRSDKIERILLKFLDTFCGGIDSFVEIIIEKKGEEQW